MSGPLETFNPATGITTPVGTANPLPVTVGGSGASAQQVQGTAADGAAAVGNPVLVAGMDGGGLAQALRLDNTGRVGIVAQGISPADGNTAATGLCIEDAATPRPLSVAGWAYNGASYDRIRNNVEGTAFASAARTTSQNGADITTYNARGLIVVIDTTVVPGSAPSNVFTVQGKDALSGKYYDLLASAAVVGVGTIALQVSPELADVTNLAKRTLLPRVIRVIVTSGNANSATYSVGYVLTV